MPVTIKPISDPIQSNDKKINIAICGQVSSGKSTAINAIVGKYISETSMKRTTRSVYTFIPPIDTSDYCMTIKEDIERQNQLDTISTAEFTTPIPFVGKDSFACSLRDYPGFNDGKEDIEGMEKIFYSHLPGLDYVIYIIDATCPLLHKSEKDLITNIFDKIKENNDNNKYTRIAFIFNKLDDEGDTEMLEMIHEAKIWLFKQMSDRYIDTVDNWFLSVSFRKMMIYSVHTSNGGNLTDIPEIILRRALTDMYGKTTAKNIIDNKSDFTLDELSDDERRVFSILKGFVDKQFNVVYTAKKFRDKLNSIPPTKYKKFGEYEQIVECIENHRYLNDINPTSYKDIVEACLVKMRDAEISDLQCLLHINIMRAIYVKYIDAVDDNNFIKNIYHTQLAIISNIDPEKSIDLTESINNYIIFEDILSKFIEFGTHEWLNEDIINCFVKMYNTQHGVLTHGYDHLCIWNAFINEGKLIVYREKGPLKSILNIDNMKKLSATNHNREYVAKFIEKIDIVLCAKLFGEIKMDDNKSMVKALYKQSSDYNREKQYPTCARMEKNWIDHKGVECGIRINKYNDIAEYHKWSSQYAAFPSEDIKYEVIGLYPQHVVNFILLNKK